MFGERSRGRCAWVVVIAVICVVFAGAASGETREDGRNARKEAVSRLRAELALAETSEHKLRIWRQLLRLEGESGHEASVQQADSAGRDRAAHSTSIMAPMLAGSSLSVEGDLALSDGSIVYKGDDVYLWEPPNEDAFWNNLGVGRRALLNNTVGHGNTAVGTDALANNSEEPSYYGYRYIARNNTAVGLEAMYNNISSTNNTAVGVQALYRLSNFYGMSEFNTALGSGAARELGEGPENTAIGAEAMRDTTVAGYATAVGSAAGLDISYSQHNTALGHKALFMGSGTTHNTAVGSGALYMNSGDFNTAVGRFTLRTNQGAENVAVGFVSLQNNTTGSGNVAIGSNALYHSTTGGNNIAIGTLAGYSLGNPPVGPPEGGSDNIFIANYGVDGDDGVIRIGANGTHVATYISGIYPNPVAGYPVYIDAAGRLGAVAPVSSKRTKESIEDLGPISGRLHELRPVSFQRKGVENARTQFGLIAEEVAEVLPELVVFDEQGDPRAVRYSLLSSLLLAEVQKQQEQLDELRERLERFEQAN